MSLRNAVQDFEYTVAQGVDNTNPPSLVQPGFLRDGRNVDLGVTGGWTRRKGYELAGDFGSRSIIQGFEYTTSSLAKKRLLVLADINGGELVEDDGGTLISIKSGLGDEKPTLIQIYDRLFYFNGNDEPFIYEGSTRSIGLEKPTVKPAVAVGGSAGNLTNAGQYLWVYTYAIKRNNRLIAESSPSPASDQFTATSTGSADLTLTLPTDPNVNLIRIYRTVAAGSIFFLEAEIAPSTNYTSTKSDEEITTLPTQLEEDNSRLTDFVNYTRPHFAVATRNRIFVVSNDKTQVRWSKIGQAGAMPESFEADKFADAIGNRGFSDKIVGIGQIKNVPIILKERSIGILEEVGLPDITGSVDNTTYIYREISDDIGALSHFAQVEVFDELVFLGRDNIYATNGATIRPIADTIANTIRTIDQRDTSTLRYAAINDTKKKRVYFAVRAGGLSANNDLVIVGDYQQYPKFRWTFYTPGDDSATHPGIQAASFFKFTDPITGELNLFFGSDKNDGKYYEMNKGETDNGKPIFFKIVSRPFHMNAPAQEKLFKGIRIFAETKSSDYPIEFCASYDLSNEEVFCRELTVPGQGGTWNNFNWATDPAGNDLIWAGQTLAELEYDPHRKGKFIQLIIKQTGTYDINNNLLDTPVTILGWGVSGSVFGLQP